MVVKRNTEDAIVTAFQEMLDSGIPVKEFVPDSDGNQCDWYFERGLTPAEQKKAKKIVSKYLDAEWSFDKA